MLTTAYAPFIHAGASNNHGRPIEQSHPATFGLWAVLDGTMTIIRGDPSAPIHLPGPAAAFITPGERHTVSAPAACRWYYLRFDVVTQARRREPDRRAWGHIGPVTQPAPQAIWGCDPSMVVPGLLCPGAIQLLRDCCSQWWRNDHLHVQANAGLGHWLMDYVIYCRHPAGNRATGQGLHQRCRDLIHERLGLGLDVADLARACGYSRAHFARLFLAETGIRPGRFIREERMAHACLLLENDDHSLNAVAERCGYRSTAAFSRAFRAHHGCGPGAWRRRRR